MSSSAHTTSVRILGHEYKIRSTESGEFVRQVALYVDELMHQMSSRMNSGTTSQIAVLAALNIAEELFRERRSGAVGSKAELEKRLKSVIGRLDEIVPAKRDTKTVES
jgi:cell division protein ZapA